MGASVSSMYASELGYSTSDGGEIPPGGTVGSASWTFHWHPVDTVTISRVALYPTGACDLEDLIDVHMGGDKPA